MTGGKQGGNGAPTGGEDKISAVKNDSGPIGDKRLDGVDVIKLSDLIDVDSERSMCYMCGEQDKTAYATVSRGGKILGIVCSSACSGAWDECKTMPLEERNDFREAYRENPECKKRRQDALDKETAIREHAEMLGLKGLFR